MHFICQIIFCCTKNGIFGLVVDSKCCFIDAKCMAQLANWDKHVGSSPSNKVSYPLRKSIEVIKPLILLTRSRLNDDGKRLESLSSRVCAKAEGVLQVITGMLFKHADGHTKNDFVFTLRFACLLSIFSTSCCFELRNQFPRNLPVRKFTCTIFVSLFVVTSTSAFYFTYFHTKNEIGPTQKWIMSNIITVWMC